VRLVGSCRGSKRGEFSASGGGKTTRNFLTREKERGCCTSGGKVGKGERGMKRTWHFHDWWPGRRDKKKKKKRKEKKGGKSDRRPELLM